MIPVLVIVSMQPDFADYYPMYKQAGRSWLDFALWEIVYLAQFFTLELFFRGFILRALRSFGAGAIWAMVVPYCMIHYGKPYLEASVAVIAGVVLGSLAMRTRSIYAGFLVHATVAVLMDILALDRRHGLPSLLTYDSARHLQFPNPRVLVWIAWALALAVLAAKVRRSWPAISGGRATGPGEPGINGRAPAFLRGPEPSPRRRHPHIHLTTPLTRSPTRKAPPCAPSSCPNTVPPPPSSSARSPTRRPAANEIAVRMAGASVNPVDWKQRSGALTGVHAADAAGGARARRVRHGRRARAGRHGLRGR